MATNYDTTSRTALFRQPKRLIGLSIFVVAVYFLVHWLGPIVSLATGIPTDVLNVISLVLLAVTWVAWLVWSLFLSGGSWSGRLGWLVLFAAPVLAFLTVFELETTGDLKISGIKLRRFTALQLDQPAQTDAVVDLTPIAADSFPGFLGPQRDGRVTGVRLDPNWAVNPPQEMWKIKVGDGWSGVAITNGFAVTMEQRGPQECVVCYRLADGAQMWIHRNPQRHDDRGNMGYAGPRSTPTIHGGKVYCQGATGTLMCLEGTTGSLLWKQEIDQLLKIEYAPSTALLTGEQFRQEPGLAWGRSISPLIVDDLVITGGGANHRGDAAGAKKFVTLIAFRQDNGEVVWEGGDEMIAYGSPNLVTLGGQQHIVLTAENHSLGIDPTNGEILWKIPFPGNSSGDANTSQTTFVDDQHVLLSKGYGRGGKLVRISSSPSGWQTAEVWSNSRILRTKLTNPVLLGGFAYSLSDGFIECAEVATGELKWKERAHLGNGQLLIVDDHLLIHSEHGKLLLAPATPDKFEPLGEVKTVSGICWNTFAVSGQFIVVRSNTEMACYRAKTIDHSTAIGLPQ